MTRKPSLIQVVAFLAMLGIDPVPFQEMTPAQRFRSRAWLWFNRDSSLRLSA